MPVYDYKCPKHGIFHELGEIKLAGTPKQCPQCQTLSPQIIMIPPAYLDMDADKKKACACNERAQHAPLKSSQLLRPDSSMSKSKNTLIHPDGTKTIPNQRPWMISH